jgi:colicin import membrane protein
MRRALQAPKLRGEGPAGPGAGGIIAAQEAGPAPAAPPAGCLEIRGNPIYSPNESLQKAASKLAALKAGGDARKPAAPVPAAPKALHTLHMAPRAPPPAADPALAPHPSDSPDLDKLHPPRRPRPSEGATPGWRPQGPDAAAAAGDDVPLAAGELMNKRNRRKSVYQRPARYGEWWSGNDDELDRMVEGEADAAAEAEEERKRQERRDKAARRKSAFPAAARAQPVPEVAAAPPPPAAAPPPAKDSAAAGSAIADKVRAIADGLCGRLDGLIEESPMEKAGRRARDDKSLRDKLLESWEGRVSGGQGRVASWVVGSQKEAGCAGLDSDARDA